MSKQNLTARQRDQNFSRKGRSDSAAGKIKIIPNGPFITALDQVFGSGQLKGDNNAYEKGYQKEKKDRERRSK